LKKSHEKHQFFSGAPPLAPRLRRAFGAPPRTPRLRGGRWGSAPDPETPGAEPPGQACSKWVSRGIRDRYFFVGIIDRAAWDIARDNDQAAGPVRVLHGIMTRPQARLDTARDTYCK